MLTRKEYQEAQRRALFYLEQAGVVLAESERTKIEVSDFGLSHLHHQGAQILTFFNTDRLSAKVIVLFPWQVLPEHWHPAVGRDMGKEEVVRVRWGEVYLYIPGPPTPNPKAKIPPGEERNFTVWQEVVLRPGDQHVIPPETVHWFQAGEGGAVIDDYSSAARDLLDGFTNPKVVRETRIVEEDPKKKAS